VATFELAGIAPEAIRVEASGRALRIQGHRPPKLADGRSALQFERSYGFFERSFPLPAGARAEEHSVSFADGILRVEIPIGER
jgi:HSP20 family protein